jgi:arylsulfatase A-like enzyme
MYSNLKFDIPFSGAMALQKTPALPSWSAMNFELEESNELIRSLRENEGIYRDYFAMVKCIDDNVGKLMSNLKKNGLDQNTIVVFTSGAFNIFTSSMHCFLSTDTL